MDVIFKIFRQEGKIVLSIVFLFVVAALIEIWLLFVPSSLEKVADQTIAESVLSACPEHADGISAKRF